MVLQCRPLVRLIETRTGPRYVVQVPEPQCPIPGWRCYSVLALGPDGERPLHLTLFERIDERPEDVNGPQAA